MTCRKLRPRSDGDSVLVFLKSIYIMEGGLGVINGWIHVVVFVGLGNSLDNTIQCNNNTIQYNTVVRK